MNAIVTYNGSSRKYDCRVEVLKNYERVIGFLVHSEINRAEDDFCRQMYAGLNVVPSTADFQTVDGCLALRYQNGHGLVEYLSPLPPGDLEQLRYLLDDPEVMWCTTRLNHRDYSFRVIAVNRS